MMEPREVSSVGEPTSNVSITAPIDMARLSDFTPKKRFGSINPRFGPIDDMICEASYNLLLIRKYWGAKEATVIGLALCGFILGTWDIGIGELSGGGEYNRWGILGDDSGFLHINELSLILSLLSILCWIGTLGSILTSYPIMRENTVYLIIGMGFVQLGYIKAHADAPNFPMDTELIGWTWVIVANLVMLFLANFVVKRAVLETRDVHVQERHAHPDPRVFERAWKDHSMVAWSIGIIVWIVLFNSSSWFGSHAISPTPGELEFSYFLVFSHSVTGFIGVVLFLAIVWFPQFMLGDSEERIQTYRAREVAGEVVSKIRDEQGKCPVCNQQTTALKSREGEINTPCDKAGCIGKGVPGSECEKCNSRISTRVVCANCGTSTPVRSHFGRVEVW
jgi:hypothetical protein